MHKILFVSLLLVAGCFEHKPEPASNSTAKLNTQLRTHIDGFLGNGEISDLSIVSVKWRFLSYRQPVHPSRSIFVRGVCQIKWLNEQMSQIKGRCLFSFEDEFGLRVRIGSEEQFELTKKKEQTTQMSFTVEFNNVEEANLVERMLVVWLLPKSQ